MRSMRTLCLMTSKIATFVKTAVVTAEIQTVLLQTLQMLFLSDSSSLYRQAALGSFGLNAECQSQILLEASL